MPCLSETHPTSLDGTIDGNGLCSEVVDIFTKLPHLPEDGKKDSYAPLAVHLLSRTAMRNRSTSPSPRRNEETDPEIQSMAMTYMTVRRGRVGQISSALNKDERDWKAAKAVMG